MYETMSFALDLETEVFYRWITITESSEGL
jgi:hypothetical protein